MIQGLLVHLVLVVIYLALTGDLSLVNIVFGAIVGFGVLLVFGHATADRHADRGRSYAARIAGLLGFTAYFVRILIVANLEVAYEILTPGYGMSPRVLRYPVDGLTDVQVTWLANAITLTPGTLSIDVLGDADDPHRCLHIHAMYGSDRDALVASLDELKRRLLEGVFGQ
jgi:multicomponent Na+:H+ antiporter subunit E